VSTCVEVSDEAKADIAELYEEDKALALEALTQIKQLQTDPYAGEKLREKSNRKPLAEADCRKLKFDHPERPANAEPRYRYRIVYRLEPGEGSPEAVYVIIVATKREAYGEGTARAAKRVKELRVLAKERTQRRRRMEGL
jgi:hypothetical protein